MINIKTPEEIKIMAEAGKILAKIIKELEKRVKSGITTKELDRAAEALIFSAGAQPSFKGYFDPEDSQNAPYPAALCASINEEIVHALPSERILKEGDILSLDLGIIFKGFHSDMAITLAVGKISEQARKIIEVTEKALEIGINEVKLGSHFGDIGFAIQKFVEAEGFTVVRDLCGHGIGRELHEEPQIFNFGGRGTGPEIKEGMVFCIEPMITAGSYKIKKRAPYRPAPSERGGAGAGSQDGFAWLTADNSLSCHFEHTVAVMKDRCEVLTKI